MAPNAEGIWFEDDVITPEDFGGNYYFAVFNPTTGEILRSGMTTNPFIMADQVSAAEDWVYVEVGPIDDSKQYVDVATREILERPSLNIPPMLTPATDDVTIEVPENSVYVLKGAGTLEREGNNLHITEFGIYTALWIKPPFPIQEVHVRVKVNG